MPRRSAVVALTGLFAILLGGVASAAWNLAGTGSGSGSASSLAAPTSPSAAAVTPTSSAIDITFTPASNPPGTTYTVTRDKTAAGAAGATVACSGLSVSACHDTGLASGVTFTYTVSAVLGSWATSAATTPSATTSGGPGAFLVSAPASATAGTAFNVTITARLSSLATDTGYTGSHALTFSGPGTSNLNNAPTFPATGSFVNGVATISVTLFKAETTTITVADGTPVRDGTSGAITVASLATTRLVFTGASTACPTGAITFPKNTNWVSFVSLADTYGNVKANGASSVAVSSSMNASSDHTLNAGASLSIAASANPGTTSGSLTVKLNAGNNKVGTVTSSAAGLGSVSCTITGI